MAPSRAAVLFGLRSSQLHLSPREPFRRSARREPEIAELVARALITST